VCVDFVNSHFATSRNNSPDMKILIPSASRSLIY